MLINQMIKLVMVFTVCVLLVYSDSRGVTARRKRAKTTLRYTDCGKDPRRPIVFYDVRVHPMPIVTPGTVYLTFSGNITKDLPRGISVELGVVKYMIGIPFPLPCFDNHLGSCLYSNICANLAEYEYRGCPKKFKQYNIQCYCPFQAGDFSLRNLPLNIPKIGGFAGAFVSVRGDYGITFRILDERLVELGCLELQFSMKRRYRGWLFKI